MTHNPLFSRNLRHRAEVILETDPADLQSMDSGDFAKLVHELRAHQIELEIQNEELRGAQLELEKSRDNFADLYEFAPVGYVSLDSDGIIREANLTAAALLGVTRESLLTSTLTKFIGRDSQDAFFLHRQAVFSCNEKKVTRLNMKTADGRSLSVRLESIVFSADENENQHCRTGLIDISDYVEAENALQTLTNNLEQRVVERTTELLREHAFVDAVLDNLPVVVLVLDSAGRVVRFNRALETATGCDYTRHLGKTSWMDSLLGGDKENFQNQVIATLQAGREPVRHEACLVNQKGEKRLFSFISTTIREVDHSVRYLTCIGLDVSDQRKSERKALQYLEEASRLQRLQTINELATTIAHELNQPCGAITMLADASQQLLDTDALDQGKLRENLNKISQEGLRGGEIIRRLRSYFRKGEIVPHPMNLQLAVEHVNTLIGPKAREHGITLVLDCDKNLPDVMGVEIHIEQVMINILQNAIEAIRDSGAKTERITVETRKANNMARVTVRDGGPGINSLVSTRIFENFHSTKEYGLGIGLRISRGLIEALGGKLWIEPQQPGGIVHFEVPLAP